MHPLRLPIRRSARDGEKSGEHASASRTRLVGGFLAFGMVCLLLLATVSSTVAGDAIQQQIGQGVTAVGSHSAVYLDQIFGGQSTSLGDYAKLADIVASAYADPGLPDRAGTSDALARLVASNHSLVLAVLISPAGAVVASTDTAAVGTDVSTQPWWTAAHSRNFAVSRPLSSKTGVTMVMVSLGVARPTAVPGTGSAVLAVEYNLQGVRTSVVDFAKAQQISLLVSNPQHDPIVSTDSDAAGWLHGDQTGPLARALAGHDGVANTTVNGRALLAAYATARNPGWVVVASLPTASAFAPVRQLQFWLLIITLALGLIFLVGVRYLNAALARQQAAERALREAAEQLEHQASHDSLTAMPNRALFTDRLEQALLLAQRRSEAVAVLFLDIDHFKQVNDTLGHHIGDLLLVQVGRRITGALRESDTAARLGGDEFAVILSGTDAAGAQRVAHKLTDVLAAPFELGEHLVPSGTSIGMAVHPADGTTFERLMTHADAAMYEVKRLRKLGR